MRVAAVALGRSGGVETGVGDGAGVGEKKLGREGFALEGWTVGGEVSGSACGGP
jgi:hypothetical protein